MRAEASAILVDAALAANVKAYIQPTVTFVYPAGRPVSEETPVEDVPVILRSALAAEQQAARFAAAGRRGVVLRLGLLDGPGTGKDHPNPSLGATLHAEDAGRALLAALTVPSGIYNVCRDGERVSNRRLPKPLAGARCDNKAAGAKPRLVISTGRGWAGGGAKRHSPV